MEPYTDAIDQKLFKKGMIYITPHILQHFDFRDVIECDLLTQKVKFLCINLGFYVVT